MDEMVKVKPTTEVNSSIWLFPGKLEKCNNGNINRQNPGKLAAVTNICREVLLVK